MNRYLAIGFLALSLVPLALCLFANIEFKLLWSPEVIAASQEAVGNRYGARP